MRSFVVAVSVLHFGFMGCELFPWPFPVLLKMLTGKLNIQPAWSGSQQELVTTIVHNAGIYNGILAAGLLWVGVDPFPRLDFARFLLASVAAAGVFGTITLKSPLTALQAALGIAGLVLLRS